MKTLNSNVYPLFILFILMGCINSNKQESIPEYEEKILFSIGSKRFAIGESLESVSSKVKTAVINDNPSFRIGVCERTSELVDYIFQDTSFAEYCSFRFDKDKLLGIEYFVFEDSISNNFLSTSISDSTLPISQLLRNGKIKSDGISTLNGLIFSKSISNYRGKPVIKVGIYDSSALDKVNASCWIIPYIKY